MIDVSLFGWLLGTLTSGLSLVLLLLALASVTFLAATGIEAARRIPTLATGVLDTASESTSIADRSTRAVGILISLAALILALFGLRVGSGEGELIPSIALALAGSTAIGAAAACLTSVATQGFGAVSSVRARQTAQMQLLEDERQRQLEAQRSAYLSGLDLRAEVVEAESALVQLRAALESMEQARASLHDKLDSTETQADPKLVEEITRARDEVALKLDMGHKVLTAAEGAAFRLACNEPLRRLVRRRPRDATQALASAGFATAGEAVILTAATSLEAFLSEVRAARSTLEALESRRPVDILPGDDDPLTRARRELDALEAAYYELFARLQIAKLRLSANASAGEVEALAGAVSGAAQGASINPREMSSLVTEVARADAAMAMAVPEMDKSRTLSNALAASSVALERSDATSLWELIVALREMR